MKNLVLVCVFSMLFASCNISDDGTNDFYYEILPVQNVAIPEEFVLGETYEIYLTYLRPSDCYVFNNFYYESELNQRTVAVINTVYPNNNCQPYEFEEEVEVSFTFLVNSNGSYVFRFWQGEDENGNDSYYIVEVPVVQ